MNNNIFFSKFGKISVDNKIITDFITAIDVYGLDIDRSFFVDYVISGCKRVEEISFEIYGTTDLYWTILLVNEIQDVFFDLPVCEEQLKSIVLKQIEDNDDDISKYYEYYKIENEKNDAKRKIKVISKDKIFTFISMVNNAL